MWIGRVGSRIVRSANERDRDIENFSLSKLLEIAWRFGAANLVANMVAW
jgi:hypothetical protein